MADVNLIGKWQWDYELASFTDAVEFNINFESGGDSYVKALFEPSTGLMYFEDSVNYDLVYSILDGVGTWYHEDYRTIEITGGEDVSSSEKLNLLSNMATFIHEEPDTPTPEYKDIDEFFTAVGDAIRTKKGTIDKIRRVDIPNEILSIAGGGTPIEIETLNSELLTEDNIGKVYKINDNIFIVKQFPEYIRFENVRTSETYDGIPYLTFSSPSFFTLHIWDNIKTWDGTLEFSTDTQTWYTWNGTNTIMSSEDGKLYMRGINNTIISRDSNFALSTYDNISCTGNIETLLDYQTVMRGEHPIMGSECFNHMFYGCTSLTTAPELPATTLAEACYFGMFNSCKSLTTAPELPATNLAKTCYGYMFTGCENITTPPTLPAIVLADECYNQMFECCTSLTSLPKLPATTLAERCYYKMFECCTKIKLSETQIDEYQNVYIIPTSGMGTTASYALYNMFISTGGTFTGTPTINTTYYTSNAVV